jgi:hypothetical protein
MPMNRDRYPGNWNEIALEIKLLENYEQINTSQS